MSKHARHATSKRHPVRMVLRVLGALVGVVIFAAVGLFAFLAVTEYNPPDVEPITPSGSATGTVKAGDELTLLTWNVGYGALGDDADFFMDGGKSVITSTKERAEENTAAITEEIERVQPDIVLLQEIDQRSNRSFYIDQIEEITSQAPSMEFVFALNYKTAFVPLGIPPYGEINSGILTLSSIPAREAQRISLPCSFEWPMSTVQMKRCQLLTRFPVEGTDRELVIINEHIDAYTNEEHRTAQVDVIRETMEQEAAAGNYVIVGGDWNHSFSNIDISDYPLLEPDLWQAGVLDISTFNSSWQFTMDASIPTCRLLNHPLVDADGTPNGLPIQYYMVDGFIVSDNVRIVSIETQDRGFVHSDHNPVVFKVVLE